MKQIDQIFDEDMFADATALDGVDANATKSLSDLVRDLQEKTEQIAASEEYLKGLKAKTEDGYRTDTHADGSDGHREVRC